MHGGKERRARRSESVGHRHGGAGLDVAQNETRRLQIAKAFSEDGVAYSRDAPTKFSEADGSVGQGAEDDTTPAFPKESKRARQRFVARRHRFDAGIACGLWGFSTLAGGGIHSAQATTNYLKISDFLFRSYLYSRSPLDLGVPMSLFRLDASIRKEGSVSREIADIVESAWREGQPDAQVTRRSVGLDPLPSTAWPLAVSAAYVADADRNEDQREAAALAATLADELIDAEALLFAVPLYNFGVSQHFKAYVDIVVTDPRISGAAPERVLAGKPAVLVVVRGGAYGPGTPREGWDHATGWFRRILDDVWGLDLRVVENEFTLAGVNPALDEFIDLAKELRRDAELLASEHGHYLAGVGVH